MEKKTESGLNKIIYWIYIAVLLLLPLRHIFLGIDWWDTGYNYSNFEYFGTKHMDSMWLFSTYLANAVGHVFTFLPFGKTLWGLNLYTGLTLSAVAIVGFVFFTKRVHADSTLTFLAEVIAIMYAWCPTALLYNYLTYIFMAVCVIGLYRGLTEDKPKHLIIAGVALALNVFVRFSNLPEVAFILAVWAYGFIEFICEKKEKTFASTVMRTLWCMVGYFGAMAVGMLYFSIRYGLGNYITSILRLFDMTDANADYKATTMVKVVLHVYVDHIYWVLRILILALPFAVLTTLVKMLIKSEKVAKILNICLSVPAAVIPVLWLYRKGYASGFFTSYDSMYRPGILLLIIVYLTCLYGIFGKTSKEEKLLSGLSVLILSITCLGSNNNVYPSMNNLFLALPIAFKILWDLLKTSPKKVSVMPIKACVLALLLMISYQGLGFMSAFVFAEATGSRNMVSRTSVNKVTAGVKMPENRAKILDGLTAYINDNNLNGTDVILAGDAPALSFYLQLAPAFNSWIDLASYSVDAFKEDLCDTQLKMDKDVEYRPIIIVETKNFEKGLGPLSESPRAKEILNSVKYPMLKDFMEENGYEADYSDEKYTVYIAK